jgi:hypothetical protein
MKFPCILEVTITPRLQISLYYQYSQLQAWFCVSVYVEQKSPTWYNIHSNVRDKVFLTLRAIR